MECSIMFICEMPRHLIGLIFSTLHPPSEKFEDTKELISSCKAKKHRQCNHQKKERTKRQRSTENYRLNYEAHYNWRLTQVLQKHKQFLIHQCYAR